MLITRTLIASLSMVAASQVFSLLESLNPGMAERLEDVSYEMLQNHSIIVLAEENSILTSKLHFSPESHGQPPPAANDTDPDDMLENFFIHMEYLPDSVSSNESEPVNVHGCFDNTYSSTSSLVAKTYGTNILTSVGPRMFIRFLGVELGLSINLYMDTAEEEKLSCSVDPGKRLQLQVTTVTTKLHLKRQRMLRFEEEGFSPGFESSPWQTLNSSHALEFSSNVVTCSTDEKFIQC